MRPSNSNENETTIKTTKMKMMTMVLGMDDDGEWNAARIFFSPQSLCLVYGEQHLSLSERVQHYLL